MGSIVGQADPDCIFDVPMIVLGFARPVAAAARLRELLSSRIRLPMPTENTNSSIDCVENLFTVAGDDKKFFAISEIFE